MTISGCSIWPLNSYTLKDEKQVLVALGNSWSGLKTGSGTIVPCLFLIEITYNNLFELMEGCGALFFYSKKKNEMSVFSN